MPGPLTERGDVSELIATEAARARAGTGRLVLLRGATGTGRTAVLEAAARDGAAHGMRVMLARCSAVDGAHPFASLMRLLSPVPDVPGCPEPGQYAPFRGGDERVVTTRLLHRLREFAEHSPVLIAIDDVHLADGASRRWLVEAARRIDQLPVLLLVTERSQYDITPPAPGLAHPLPPDLVRTHTLAPLSARSTALLVRSLAECGRWSCAESCVRASAGHPLLLHALLGDLGDSGAVAVPDSSALLYPGAYRAAVSWWLECAGPRTTEVARALAALEETWTDGTDGPPVPASPHGSTRAHAPAHPAFTAQLAELLAGMTGADAARVAGWLTAMTGLGLLHPDASGRPRWAHRLLRDAVLDGWPAGRRRAAHLAAADTLWRRGDDTEAVARQLLRTDTADRPWIVNVLRDAAHEAARDGRVEDATDFLRRVLREPLSEPVRQRVLTELGSLEFAAAQSGGWAGGLSSAWSGGPSSAWSGAQPGLPPGLPPVGPAGTRSDGRPAAVRATGVPRLTEALWLPGEPADRVRAGVALGTALARYGQTRAAVETLHGLDDDGLSDRPELVRAVRATAVLLAERDRGLRREAYARLAEQDQSCPEPAGTAGRALLVRHAAAAGLISAEEARRRLRLLLEKPADPEGEPLLVAVAAVVALWADDFDSAGQLVEHGLAGQCAHLLHPVHEILLTVRADLAAARGTYTLPRHTPNGPAGDDPPGHGPAGHDPTGHEPVGQGPTGQEPVRQGPTGQEPVGQGPTGQEPTGQRPTGHGPVGRTAAGHVSAGHEPVGQMAAGHEPVGQMPDRHVPMGQVPGSQAPDRHVPMGHGPAGHGPAEHGPAGHDPAEHVPPEHEPDGQVPPEHEPDGQVPPEHARAGNAPRGAGPYAPPLREEFPPPSEEFSPRAGASPASAGAYPAPAGAYPAPAGPFPAPAGPFPAPAGAFLAPTGASPAPAGAYPPPPGAHPASADGRPRQPGVADAHAVLALVAAGRVGEAGRFVAAFDLDRTPDSPERNRFLYARGVQRAAAGNPAGAVYDFLECGRSQAARDEVSPALTPWRTAAAECHLALGRPRDALALAEEELRLARVWNTPRTVGRALRVLAAATGGRRGLDLAEEAVRLLRTAPVDDELIAALISRGRLLITAGERSQARAALREAADRAVRRGAVRLAAAAEAALREGGARRPAAVRTGSDALTGSERRIAELAAAGHTNTEIAGLLHVARRTVETHLTSTYRKLGIRRRAQLRTALGNAAARPLDKDYCHDNGRP
ncbi:helix-turn-helix transcriptional regulator [Streptomyces sp. NBC_00670]|uniref:helix-turn-helix transcriptional regulator n=1 Tax=Streptomyces sp. NBC_00670 TaxID=2975804 RepID=UPI002E32E07D|nr:AAA family ATPase [Streptomyces sp. NBC_00670]